MADFSRKRHLKTEDGPPRLQSWPNEPSRKRLKLKLSTPDFVAQLPTPIATPPSMTQTLNLSLEIPLKDTEVIPKAVLAARKGAATRWRSKLQDPFPSEGEIKKAYSTKLLRHYPAPNSTSPDVAPYIKPRIEKSQRVATLLKQFPKLEIPIPPTTMVHTQDTPDYRAILQHNREITRTDEAVKLAWENFSLDRRGLRGAMVESGLRSEDCQKEFDGEPNQLPEWRKWHTGKFVTEERREEVDRKLLEAKKQQKSNPTVSSTTGS